MINSVASSTATAIAVATASILLVAGCSSSGEASGESPNSQGADNTAVLGKYFNAFATDKSSTMAPMLEASEPGSPAYLYAQHQINGATASEAAGNSAKPATVDVTDTTVTMKQDVATDATDAQIKEATNVYSSFQYSTAGLIQTWTADPGGPLAGRISAQSAKGKAGGVAVTLRTAYLTNSGDLSVTFDAKNTGSKKASLTPTGYVNPDGRQVKVVTTGGSLDLQPGSFATDALSVTAGKNGGTLIFQVDYQKTLKLKVT